MIYTKFHCNAEISCSANKQINKILFIYKTTNLCIAMKLNINHPKYLKYLYKKKTEFLSLFLNYIFIVEHTITISNFY